MPGRITGLFVHPIKSCKAQTVQSAGLTPLGARGACSQAPLPAAGPVRCLLPC